VTDQAGAYNSMAMGRTFNFGGCEGIGVIDTVTDGKPRKTNRGRSLTGSWTHLLEKDETVGWRIND
jgi:hypothetical protein